MKAHFRKSALPVILLASTILFVGCATHGKPPSISLDEPMQAQALRALADEGGMRVLRSVQPGRRHAHHAGLGAAVEEELKHRVAEFAAFGQPTELAFVVGEVLDVDRLVERSAHGRPQESGNRGRRAGNGAHACGNFLDIHPGMRQGRDHELLLSTAT